MLLDKAHVLFSHFTLCYSIYLLNGIGQLSYHYMYIVRSLSNTLLFSQLHHLFTPSSDTIAVARIMNNMNGLGSTPSQRSVICAAQAQKIIDAAVATATNQR